MYSNEVFSFLSKRQGLNKMILFWFLLLTVKPSYEIVKIEKSQADAAVRDCLSKVISFLARLKVSFWYFEGNNEDVVSDLLKTVQTPVVLNTVDDEEESGVRVHSEIVVVFGEVNVDRLLGETLWNGATLFFVVADKFEDVERDLRNFWKRKVINVFEMVRHEEGVDVYSFIPYQKGNCTLVTPELVDKYQWNVGKFVNYGNAFRDKTRMKNMNGCPVNITVVDVKPNVIFKDECGCNGTTHLQGIEGNLMNEVARRLNFNATFLIALDGIGWGWIRPSPHGAVGEVFTGRSDFAIGLLAPTVERYENLDISLPYNGEECITYGVPTGAGASTPNWITILTFEYNPITWLLIFLSFILVIIFFEFVNKFLLFAWLPTKTDVILFVFSSCLGLPVKIPKYFYLRLSLFFWFTVSFIITVAYKSSMGSKLTVPNRDPDINTFQELLNSDLEFTGYNNMLRLLQFSDNETVIHKMIQRFKTTDFDIDYAVDRIAAERKIAYVRHTSTFLYYALINPKAKGHIHIIKDCIYLYHPMVVTKKNSPFSPRLNQLISRLLESGITKKWRSDYIYDAPPPAKPFLPLSSDHMYGVFCILALGYVLGILLFSVEIIHFRCNAAEGDLIKLRDLQKVGRQVEPKEKEQSVDAGQGWNDGS